MLFLLVTLIRWPVRFDKVSKGENILRICSDSRPAIYQAMSDEKERDMLVELKDRLKQRDVR
jgi:hypothetical protein